MTRVTDRELELQAEVDRLCGALFRCQQEKDRCVEENVTLRKAVDLYEASDNLVIKNEAEVERLRAFARSKESNELAIAAELDEANAKLAKAREALEKMVELYGLCWTVIDSSRVQVVTAEMATTHCDRCPPCLARQVLKEIKG